jgi:F-box-like
VTIDTLPDVALLEIFNFYVDEAWIEGWCTLVHVCRKWRNIVFGSPRRLKLRLYCEARTPVRETLDVWPLLPIVIRVYGYEMWGVDNIIAALEHNDRICQLELIDIPSSQMEKVLAAMQQPFPALTRLELQPRDVNALAVPPSFLGGTSPRLQTLTLDCVLFPGLPKLLMSATHLVRLYLYRIPHSGYISPEALTTCLSVLTRLESLVIRFESPLCRPDWKSRRPPPRTRTLLPALTLLQFRGVSEYLEDLAARIDAPLLDKLVITFFHQLLFDTPQITQFISRTPKFKAHAAEAHVVFSDSHIRVTFPQTLDGALELGISCSQSDWQLSSLAQVCSSSFPQTLIPAVEHLYILKHRSSQLRWQDDIEGSQWLECLNPFASAKGLYVSQEFAPRIAPALQALVGKSVTEMLPTLQNLFLEEPQLSGHAQEAIGQFVAARQLASHPIAVSRWERG